MWEAHGIGIDTQVLDAILKVTPTVITFQMNYCKNGNGVSVILVKLSDGDRVLGFLASKGDRDILRVETSRGAELTISTVKYEITGRGGRGRELLQRGQFMRVIPAEVENPQPFTDG